MFTITASEPKGRLSAVSVFWSVTLPALAAEIVPFPLTSAVVLDMRRAAKHQPAD